jgi:hypothetical protein
MPASNTSYLAFVPQHAPTALSMLAMIDRGDGPEAETLVSFLMPRRPPCWPPRRPAAPGHCRAAPGRGTNGRTRASTEHGLRPAACPGRRHRR